MSKHGQQIQGEAFAQLIRPLPFHLRNFTIEEGGCWSWNGYLTESGYGRTTLNGKIIRAHRAVYSILKGPLIEGLVIDHLCRNRRCLNPQHLEQVTQAVNMERSVLSERNPHKNPEAKCKRGHALTPENTKKVGKSQTCRECWREAKRRSYARKRAA